MWKSRRSKQNLLSNVTLGKHAIYAASSHRRICTRKSEHPIPFESIVDSWSIFSLHFLYSRTHHINKKLDASVVLMVCGIVNRLQLKFWQVFLFLDPSHRRDNKKWRCKNRPKFFTWCCELPDFDFSNFCFASILLHGVASNIYDVVKREAPPRCFKV